MAGSETKCGLVCIIGLPNAGKSTLVNQIVGTKVSIVSPKKQTTRFRLCGIAMRGQSQIVLVDTPGVFETAGDMERSMVEAAWRGLHEADIVLHLVDASVKQPLGKNKFILQKMGTGKKTVLVLNKTDLVHKPDLLAAAAALNEAHPYAATFMVSALKGTGAGDLADFLGGALPQGPYLYDEDQISNMPMRIMAAEITREKIFEQLYQELPHAAYVETEHWEAFDNGSVKIDQVIFVKKESQKSIVLGKGGARIKQIGQAARLELEKIYGQRFHLKLFVKVQEDWQKREDFRALFHD